jgi:hypothetical protein
VSAATRESSNTGTKPRQNAFEGGEELRIKPAPGCLAKSENAPVRAHPVAFYLNELHVQQMSGLLHLCHALNTDQDGNKERETPFSHG